MVTWGLVLETAVKWLIPVICVAIMGLLTAHFLKPFKKGTEVQSQEDWDKHFVASSKPKEMGDKELGEFRKEVAKADNEILKQIGELNNNISAQNETNKMYHQKVDESINLIKQGVRDAHLQNLIATCKTYIRRGYILDTEYEAYKARYDLYKELGGNGHMDYWHDKIKGLPREEPAKSTTHMAETTTKQITPPKTHK